MKPGEKFHIAGYDVIALAGSDHGHVIVLSNNSSHYLVAMVGSSGTDLSGQGIYTLQMNPVATLCQSFRYTTGFKEAYKQSLSYMRDLVLQDTEDA